MGKLSAARAEETEVLQAEPYKSDLSKSPCDLYETYDRILLSIEKDVAYAKSPRSLGELVEANIIDLTGSGLVDFADRGDLEDSLAILSGFVTIVATDDDDQGDSDEHQSSVGDLDNGGINEEDRSNSNLASMARDLEESDMFSGQQYRSETVVRLAHFSVKEYLESSHILDSDAKVFHLDPAREHRLLTQIAQQPGTEGDYEALLFTSEEVMHDWLLVHQPDVDWLLPFEGVENKGSGLYYASSIGLGATVLTLIEKGADVNAQGGYFGNALQAASEGGHEEVVAILLKQKAKVNAQGGEYGNALQAASTGGNEKVVAMLLDCGADVNARGGRHGNALQMASNSGHERVVAMLLERGANVNAQGGWYPNALQAALDRGHERVVAMLLERGAKNT
ncbi:hypothetical protein LTR17_027677 [Elasticomyces elasticus]|nr:hypothetical protein LTR17_027677 [Elasticomyces elasticus]